MSYSRWLCSRWYTFWGTGSGQTKDDQIFEICMDGRFSYKELNEDIDACLDKVCDEHVSRGERHELKGYMLQFMDDVEKTFSDERIVQYEELKKKISIGTCFRFRDRPNDIMEVSKVRDFDILGGGQVCFIDTIGGRNWGRWEDINTLWGWMQGDYNPLQFCDNGLKKARDMAKEDDS